MPTSISGNIKDLGIAATSGVTMRFWLRGCQGNQPRVNGSALIAPTQGGVFYFDLISNSSGAISGTLYSTRDAAGTGNGEIEVGGSFTAVWYGMQAIVNGKAGPEVPVHAKNGVTLDITNVTPISTTPVSTAPTGDSTYLRLDGGNSPITGSIDIKNVNSVPNAGQYTASALAALSVAPGISKSESGGTVAANSYKAKITFNGASGETEASSASSSVTVSGSTGVLYAQPLECPSGAVSYNVYWQTGGSGSYYRGHTGIALTAADVQTSSPATTGTTAPSSSTATSKVAAAQAALSGSAGRFDVPSALSASDGQCGNLGTNQSFIDNRTGHIGVNTNTVSPNKSAVGALGSAWFLDLQVPSALGTKQQWNGIEVIAHDQNTPSYWGGVSDSNNVVAIASTVIRDGSRNESCWGINAIAAISNNNAPAFGAEINLNFSGTPTQSENGGIGLRIASGGSAQAWEALNITGIGTGTFYNGIDIRPNSYAQSGLVIGASSGSAFGIDCDNAIRARGAAGSDMFVRDSDSSSAAIYDRWKDNGTAKWTLAKTASNDLQLFDEANSGFTRLAFNAGTNGNTLINAPGTGAVVVSNSDIQLTLGKLDTKTGGSTTISTGVGSVKMSSANPGTNTVWIPMKYNGTTYYVPGWTTNAP